MHLSFFDSIILHCVNREQTHRPPIKQRHLLVPGKHHSPQKGREPEAGVAVGLVLAYDDGVRDR